MGVGFIKVEYCTSIGINCTDSMHILGTVDIKMVLVPMYIFFISCLYLCLTEPLQKLRARLGAYKTGLSPPVILYY